MTLQREEGMDLWTEMSSNCSFTCICGIVLPLNPSTTTVYARSAFYPSLRFTLSLQSAFYTQSAFYPWSAVCVLHWPIKSGLGRRVSSKNSDFCNFCDSSKNCEKLEKSQFLLKLIKSSITGGRRLSSKNCNFSKNCENWRNCSFAKINYDKCWRR